MILDLTTFEDFVREITEDKIATVRKAQTFAQKEPYVLESNLIFTALNPLGFVYRFMESSTSEVVRNDEEAKAFTGGVEKATEEKVKKIQEAGVEVKEGLYSNL